MRLSPSLTFAYASSLHFAHRLTQSANTKNLKEKLFMLRSKAIGLVLASVAGAMPAPLLAEVGNTPVFGGLFNSSEVLKNQVVSSLSYSTRFARDVTLFTIGGMTLETYLLTLPLDTSVKARVMKQIADPSYAIPLGYFLYQYYDRYSGLGNEDEFRNYLFQVYDKQALTGFQHSLFQVEHATSVETKQHEKDQAHQEGIKVDGDFIAALVTVYDALVQIGEWQDQETLPEQYRYLTQSAEDLALVAKIEPIVLNILQQVASGMDEGEMKHALNAIIEDGKPEHKNKVNNKAQAITVTLIDFVRLNVLKAYRQFVYQDERQQALDHWLQEAFDDDPEALLAFLASQQQRRLAVQVTVDGLQQGLLEGLVSPNKPFVSTAYDKHLEWQAGSDQRPDGQKPAHKQQMRFLQTLATQPYQDPYYLPFFKRLYQNHEDSIARVGISSTPTISVRNLPIIKTGARVEGEGGTGIPNFHFVDRHEDRAYYFFGNDALQLDRIMQKNRVQTMFDRLVYLKTLNCNAQYDWNAHTTYDGLVNLGAGEALRDFGEKRCLRELNERAKVEVVLQQMRSDLIRDVVDYQEIPFWDIYTRLTRKWKIEQDLTSFSKLDAKGMPDYTLVYNPWPDHFAHFVGPFSDEIIMPTGELNRLDYWLGALENAYQQAGVYERTLWGMAGDHGLSPVYRTLNPEKAIFEPLQRTLGYPLVMRKISSDEGEGPKMTNALNFPSNKGVDVVVASTAGGNFMLDFFNSNQSWQTQPLYQELTQWRPVNAGSEPVIDIVNWSVKTLADSLDYLAVRETACSAEHCKVRLIATRDGKRVDEFVEKVGEKYAYFAAKGQPSLLEVSTLNPYLPTLSEDEEKQRTLALQRCLGVDSQRPETWCDKAQWRALTRFTTRPDSVVQLAHLYLEERAGTINLFPKEGVGYNTKVPGRHAGESYLEKDAFIGFWGAPIGNNTTPLTSEENGSLAPTLYEYLTGESVVAGENGWGFPSLLNKLGIESF
ncbi:TPA: nucleotide pyrophosphatase [Vibrio vulnificus]|nr:nucleotide pyrophosphatase [Vibrio vulnificus]